MTADGSPRVTSMNTPPCGYCGAYHTGTCPRVKSIEYHPNGQVARVEFHDPNQVLRDPQGWPLLFPIGGKSA